jgi:hypothetical protein
VKHAAVASQECAQNAAIGALEAGGTAIDAVIAGFFAAAGASAGVLLCPVQVLVAGPGVGPRAFDGRSRQPGHGLPRPRGVVEGQAVPPAALVAVPASLAALSLAHAYDGVIPIAKLVAPGIAEAKSRGKRARDLALARVAASGAAAIRDRRIAGALLAVGGRAQGGLLSEEDLVQVRPSSAAPRRIDLGDDGAHAALVSPWSEPEGSCRTQEVVAAGDSRGVLAVLAYAPDEDGVDLPDVELRAPRDAVIVRRGVPRLRSGEPIGCPAPMLISVENDRPVLVLGLGIDHAVPRSAITSTLAGVGATAPAILRALADATGAATAVAVVRSLGKKQMKGLSLR